MMIMTSASTSTKWHRGAVDISALQMMYGSAIKLSKGRGVGGAITEENNMWILEV